MKAIHNSINALLIKSLPLPLALLWAGAVYGQNLGNAASANQNYIQKTTYLGRFTSVQANPLTDSAMRDITYFDGLGRPVQELGVRAAPGKARDVVTPVAYDGFGRQDKDYLPYATTTGVGGAFKASAVTQQATYYNTPPTGVVQISASGGVTPSFGPRKYEASPLNRVLEQGFPGLAWQPGGSRGTTGRTVATEHTTNNILAFDNTATRRVLRYGATLSATGVPTLTLNSFYAAGELYVTVTKDENWTSGRLNTTEEYTDKLGRMVLRRTFTTATGAAGILSTYYVYNDLGQLSFVLPPGRDAEFNPDSGTLPTATMLDNFAYRYRYDRWGRVSYRRLPGGGAWENYNYNRMGWLVYHQDSRQQLETYAGSGAGQYHHFTKYDGQGRVIMKGVEHSRSQNRETIEGYFQGHAHQWEERSRASGHLHGYTNNSMPGAAVYMDILEVNYYDRYDTIPGLPVAPLATHSKLTHGKLVASKVKVLGTTDTYLWSVYFYDNKGNVVREWKQHYLGGTRTATKFDDIIREYTFAGQLRKETRKHHTTNATTPEVTVTTEYDHDHRGRQTHAWKTVNTGTRTLIARNTYNEVGQLREKDLHSTNSGTSFAHKVTYGYNERGWLRSSETGLFKQYLKYADNITGLPNQYNGNITRQEWQHGASAMQYYHYRYDAVNRLVAGNTAGGQYREALRYDRNGNITHLGRTANSSTLVDTLAYSHTGNRLMGVVDNNANTGAAYQLPGTTSYLYDANGNMTSRMNTASTANNISAIAYNYFNLPQTVTAVAGNATYVYDGQARKLRSTVAGTTTDYIDGIEWQGATLNLIHMEEGRIIRSGSNYLYEYVLKDHLGNSRSGFAQGSPTVANLKTDYYPFGLQHQVGIVAPPSPKNRYLYNGKELQDGLKVYDYGARFYDPVIGRWGAVDPLAEEFDNLSPYNYGMNNPILMIDPDGMAADTIVMVPNQPLPESAKPGDVVIDDDGGASTLLPSATARPFVSMSMAGSNTSPYLGPMGILRYILTGGEENGYKYDINGRNLGPLPNMGYPMDFSRGNPVSSARTIAKSINQLNRLVNTGKTPRGIKRFDKGRGTKNLPQDEVHFDNGSSLYRDGTWRHDKGHKLTNDQIEFLELNGWIIP